MPSRPATVASDAARFWSRVQKGDGCWLIAGHAHRSGHVEFWLRGRMVKAHRFAYELQVGPIPDGMWVLHTCDVPRCVRRDHLYLGDAVRNNLDRDERGRHQPLPGSRNGNARLTETDVLVIKVLLYQGGIQSRIAAAFGVDKTLISLIAQGHAWAHVRWDGVCALGYDLLGEPLICLPQAHRAALDAPRVRLQRTGEVV